MPLSKRNIQALLTYFGIWLTCNSYWRLRDTVPKIWFAVWWWCLSAKPQTNPKQLSTEVIHWSWSIILLSTSIVKPPKWLEGSSGICAFLTSEDSTRTWSRIDKLHAVLFLLEVLLHHISLFRGWVEEICKAVSSDCEGISWTRMESPKSYHECHQ